MKIRNLLVGFVLAMMVLFAGSIRANTAQVTCTQQCAYDHTICMTDCNGAPRCQEICNDDYYCCLKLCNNEPCE